MFVSISLRTLVAIAVCVTVVGARAAEWGGLKGKFVLDVKVAAESIKVSQDAAFCGPFNLKAETVVAGDDGGLANVFVYLNSKKVDVHPDYESAAGKNAVLDNNECRFEPHALTVWTKQPLEIRNSDKGIGHNTNAQNLFANTKFNELVTNDKPITKKFEKSETFPSEFKCNVHPWMSSFVLIRDNPYMVASGKDGSFEIKNIPAGKHEFVFWHEGAGVLKKTKVGGETTDRKGRVELTIKAGEPLDLGDIKLAPKQLGK